MRKLICKLLEWLQKRPAAVHAAQRLRNVLAYDRCILRHETVKALHAEVAAVLERYFSIGEYSCSVETKQDAVRYTVEAELLQL